MEAQPPTSRSLRRCTFTTTRPFLYRPILASNNQATMKRCINRKHRKHLHDPYAAPIHSLTRTLRDPSRRHASPMLIASGTLCIGKDGRLTNVPGHISLLSGGAVRHPMQADRERRPNAHPDERLRRLARTDTQPLQRALSVSSPMERPRVVGDIVRSTAAALQDSATLRMACAERAAVQPESR